MKYLSVCLMLTMLSVPLVAFSEEEHGDHHDHHDHHGHHGDYSDEDHTGHVHHDGHVHAHETAVDGSKLDVSSERFDTFAGDLSNVQIAIVSVRGMVCDFCARGLEKTFKKDKLVYKIDVDLDIGKILIAYDKEKVIEFKEIEDKVLANGQNALDLQIIEV